MTWLCVSMVLATPGPVSARVSFYTGGHHSSVVSPIAFHHGTDTAACKSAFDTLHILTSVISTLGAYKIIQNGKIQIPHN